jgi:hypothetical protein
LIGAGAAGIGNGNGEWGSGERGRVESLLAKLYSIKIVYFNAG